MIDDEVDSFFEEMLQEEKKKVQQVGEIIHEKESVYLHAQQQYSGSPHADGSKNKSEMAPEMASLNLDAAPDRRPQSTTFITEPLSSEPSTPQFDNPQQLLQSIQRDLNRLSSQERSHRLASMHKLLPLLKHSFQQSASNIHHLFRFIYSVFIKLLEDELESLRESGCELLLELYRGMLQEEDSSSANHIMEDVSHNGVNDIQYSTSRMDQVDESLALLIPVLSSRLQNEAHHPQPRESSEEVRHLMMQLFVFVFSNFEISDYLKPLCRIIRERLEDNFHKIKQLACESVIVLCNTRDGAYKRFLDNNPVVTKLITSLTPNLMHQRHYVRAMAVLALNELIMIRPGGESLKDLAKIIRKLASDNSRNVRENLLKTCENWFINHQDTFSFQDIFITPILIMHSDELQSIQEEALRTMDRLGQKHEEWNEEKLKDQLEYAYEDVSQATQVLPTPFHARPRLGSRLIVKHNFKKLFALIQESLSEWSLQQKKIYSQLLTVLTVYTEKDITQHMDKMLQNWFKVIQDDEPEIRQSLQEGVRIAGRYAEPDAYLPHIFSFTRAQYATSPITLANVLIVFSVILEDITPDNLKMLSKSYQKIGSELQASHLIYHEDKRVVAGILRTVKRVILSAESMHEADGFEYFLLLHKVWALPSNAAVADPIVPELLKELATKLSLSGQLSALYKQNFRRSIDLLVETRDTWDKASPEMFAFELIIKKGIASAEEHSSFVFSHLKNLTQKGQDAAVVSTMFSIIEHMFQTVGHKISNDIDVIVDEIIGVNLPWTAGKTKLRTRMLGISCLNVILNEDLCSDVQLKMLVEHHHKSIVSTLDEFADDMRILSTRSFSTYLIKVHHFLSAKQWQDSFKVLVELLDDKLDQVRVQAVETLGVLFKYVPNSIQEITGEEVFRPFVGTLFIHLDDSNREVQNAVFKTLDSLNQSNPNHAAIISQAAQSMEGRHFVSPHTKLLLQKLQQET
uniref:Uncharacterized protein n=1 Tax=Percolomonas cosmopolitus TaxID=63605 RepID=A0A7S1PIB9_9EUKA|mmetsp:Transcript_7566/g.28428  ORF Transcript_7566/g.28428 Transcript_7566/m.28428 type:complete len:971 (+) Transcript_7566:4592-7504(+)